MGDSATISFLKDFAAGGVSGCIAKCCTAPIERVKLIIQTQDANPKIISGCAPHTRDHPNSLAIASLPPPASPRASRVHPLSPARRLGARRARGRRSSPGPHSMLTVLAARPFRHCSEVPRYTGIVNVFQRVAAEQGIAAFWRGNLVNCIRYFPTQVTTRPPR